ncbi:hypothetical protein [endosymbiont GvMRE of Glomus versiforme]|uniref:hypothetical protein n=1 Tax=endosymbiont GvMRE of Glomus versiforme TaxID=2039283 RepID=UPI001FE65E73|nr:hypothetical protein [endosymbiont GvMRE of Glomus versiforme]
MIFNENEINDLREKLNLASLVWVDITKKNAELEAEINVLKEKLDEEEKLATAGKIVDQEKYDNLYKDWELERGKNDTLKTENNKLKWDNGDKQRQINKLNETIAKNDKDWNEEKVENKKTFTNFKNNNDKLRKDNGELKKEIDRLENAFSKLEKEHQKISAENGWLTLSNHNFELRAKKLNGKINELENELQRTKNELEHQRERTDLFYETTDDNGKTTRKELSVKDYKELENKYRSLKNNHNIRTRSDSSGSEEQPQINNKFDVEVDVSEKENTSAKGEKTNASKSKRPKFFAFFGKKDKNVLGKVQEKRENKKSSRVINLSSDNSESNSTSFQKKPSFPNQLINRRNSQQSTHQVNRNRTQETLFSFSSNESDTSLNPQTPAYESPINETNNIFFPSLTDFEDLEKKITELKRKVDIKEKIILKNSEELLEKSEEIEELKKQNQEVFNESERTSDELLMVRGQLLETESERERLWNQLFDKKLAKEREKNNFLSPTPSFRERTISSSSSSSSSYHKAISLFDKVINSRESNFTTPNTMSRTPSQADANFNERFENNRQKLAEMRNEATNAFEITPNEFLASNIGQNENQQKSPQEIIEDQQKLIDRQTELISKQINELIKLRILVGDLEFESNDLRVDYELLEKEKKDLEEKYNKRYNKPENERHKNCNLQKGIVNELKKELEGLRHELENKNLDKGKGKAGLAEDLTKENRELNEQLNAAQVVINDLETTSANRQEVINKNSDTINRLGRELDEVNQNYRTSQINREAEIARLNEIIRNKDKEKEQEVEFKINREKEKYELEKNKVVCFNEAEHEERNKDLNEKLTANKAKLEENKLTIGKLEGDKEHLNTELNNEIERNGGLTAQIEGITETKNGLETQLNEANEAKTATEKALQEQINNYTLAIAAKKEAKNKLITEKTNHDTTKGELGSEIKRIIIEKEELEKAKTGLENQVKSLSETSQSYKEEIENQKADLANQVAEKEQTIITFQQQIKEQKEKAEQQQNEWKEFIDDLVHQLGEGDQKSETGKKKPKKEEITIEVSKKTLQEITQNLQRKLRTVKNSLNVCDDNLEKAQNEINRIKGKLGNIEDEYLDKLLADQRELAVVRAELAEIKSEKASLERQLNELTSTITSLNEQLTNKQNDHKEVQDQLILRNNELSELGRKINEQNTKITSLTGQLNNKRKELREAQDERDKKQKAYEGIHRDLNYVIDQRLAKQIQIDNLKNDFKKKEAELTQAKNEKVVLESKLTAEQEEHNKTKTNLTNANNAKEQTVKDLINEQKTTSSLMANTTTLKEIIKEKETTIKQQEAVQNELVGEKTVAEDKRNEAIKENQELKNDIQIYHKAANLREKDIKNLEELLENYEENEQFFDASEEEQEGENLPKTTELSHEYIENTVNSLLSKEKETEEKNNNTVINHAKEIIRGEASILASIAIKRLDQQNQMSYWEKIKNQAQQVGKMLNETSRQVKSYLVNTDGKTLKALGFLALSGGSAYAGYQAYPYLNSVNLPSNQVNFNENLVNNFTNPFNNPNNSTPPYYFNISFELPINSTHNTTQTFYFDFANKTIKENSTYYLNLGKLTHENLVPETITHTSTVTPAPVHNTVSQTLEAETITHTSTVTPAPVHNTVSQTLEAETITHTSTVTPAPVHNTVSQTLEAETITHTSTVTPAPVHNTVSQTLEAETITHTSTVTPAPVHNTVSQTLEAETITHTSTVTPAPVHNTVSQTLEAETSTHTSTVTPAPVHNTVSQTLEAETITHTSTVTPAPVHNTVSQTLEAENSNTNKINELENILKTEQKTNRDYKILNWIRTAGEIGAAWYLIKLGDKKEKLGKIDTIDEIEEQLRNEQQNHHQTRTERDNYRGQAEQAKTQLNNHICPVSVCLHHDYQEIKQKNQELKIIVSSLEKDIHNKETQIIQKLITDLELINLDENANVEQVIETIRELINKPPTTNIEYKGNWENELEIANQTITKLEKELKEEQTPFGEDLQVIKNLELTSLTELFGQVNNYYQEQIQQAANYQQVVNARQAFIQEKLSQKQNTLSVVNQPKQELIPSPKNEDIILKVALIGSLITIGGLIVRMQNVKRNKQIKN